MERRNRRITSTDQSNRHKIRKINLVRSKYTRQHFRPQASSVCVLLCGNLLAFRPPATNLSHCLPIDRFMPCNPAAALTRTSLAFSRYPSFAVI
jgi:hypothetical protein